MNDICILGLKEKQSTHDLSLIIEWTITQVDWLSSGKDIWEHHSFNIHLVNKWTSLKNLFYLISNQIYICILSPIINL